MSIRRPPALAAWLLDRLGYTRENPALAGDLLEEFQTGRSPAWYWRQAAMVILNGARRNAVVLQWYLEAVAAGLLAEVLTAYVLWRFQLPQRAPDPGLGILSSFKWLLFVIAVILGFNVFRRLIFGGRALIDLKALFAASRAGAQTRPEIAASVFVETFALYLWIYCAVVIVSGPSSPDVFIYWHAVVLTRGLMPALWRMLNAG